jgi:hypothetical protein
MTSKRTVVAFQIKSLSSEMVSVSSRELNALIRKSRSLRSLLKRSIIKLILQKLLSWWSTRGSIRECSARREARWLTHHQEP